MTFDPPEDEEAQGRWKRSRSDERGSRVGMIVLIVIGVVLLLAAGVAVFAGRPIAFYVVDRMTTRKFPDLRWITGQALASWRADSSRQQPVVLDARTETEYAVSHLADATRIDPYRPLLRPLKGQAQDVPIVVYASVGYRSARVADWLKRQGYGNVQNLEGGFFAGPTTGGRSSGRGVRPPKSTRTSRGGA